MDFFLVDTTVQPNYPAQYCGAVQSCDGPNLNHIEL